MHSCTHFLLKEGGEKRNSFAFAKTWEQKILPTTLFTTKKQKKVCSKTKGGFFSLVWKVSEVFSFLSHISRKEGKKFQTLKLKWFFPLFTTFLLTFFNGSNDRDANLQPPPLPRPSSSLKSSKLTSFPSPIWPRKSLKAVNGHQMHSGAFKV